MENKSVLERIMLSEKDVLRVESEIRFHEHLRRYAAIRRYCYGKVLDFASGCGYGSHIISMSPEIERVVGIDKDDEAIQWAQTEFGSARTEFRNIDIELVCEKFDTLVSLEAIEHFEDESVIPRLAERCDVDQVIISYPNKKSTHFNPYHVRDFNAQQILDLMHRYVCYRSFTMGDVQFMLLLKKPDRAPSHIFSNLLDLRG